jgi:hypothetical protein
MFVRSDLQLSTRTVRWSRSNRVTEAMTADGQLFGDERLEGVLRRSNGAPLKELQQAIQVDLAEFVAGGLRRPTTSPCWPCSIKGNPAPEGRRVFFLLSIHGTPPLV